jgi:hypothetical protein
MKSLYFLMKKLGLDFEGEMLWGALRERVENRE